MWRRNANRPLKRRWSSKMNVLLLPCRWYFNVDQSRKANAFTLSASETTPRVAPQVEQLILPRHSPPWERLRRTRKLARGLRVRPHCEMTIAQLFQAAVLAANPRRGSMLRFLGQCFFTALTELFARPDEAVRLLFVSVRDMEGLAAERQPGLGSDTEFGRDPAVFDQDGNAHTQAHADDEAQLDASVSHGNYEASHNVIMASYDGGSMSSASGGVFLTVKLCSTRDHAVPPAGPAPRN